MLWMGTLEITTSCIHFSRKMWSRIYFCVFLHWLCCYIFSKMRCYWWPAIPLPRLGVGCRCWCIGRTVAVNSPFAGGRAEASAVHPGFHICWSTSPDIPHFLWNAGRVPALAPAGVHGEALGTVWFGWWVQGTPQEGYSDASLLCSQRWS